MSEPENFLERWSRRKREAAEDSAPAAKVHSQETETEKKTDADPRRSPEANEIADKPFDVASLPSIDSITANTDVRAFMQAGVPPDLTRAALRRAWSTDPQIRDFVGLVENGWDFNDPNAMHGFGPIEPSEVARLMGNFALTPPLEPERIAETNEAKAQQLAQPLVKIAQQEAASPTNVEPRSDSPLDAIVQCNEKDAAVQNDSENYAQSAAPKNPEPT
jgi:hypothetical protein